MLSHSDGLEMRNPDTRVQTKRLRDVQTGKQCPPCVVCYVGIMCVLEATERRHPVVLKFHGGGGGYKLTRHGEITLHVNVLLSDRLLLTKCSEESVTTLHSLGDISLSTQASMHK